MHIGFFEEYPTRRNLSKLRLVPFKTDLYLGSSNVKRFLELKRDIKRRYKNVDEVIYWPILALSEGYWISAFAQTRALKRIIAELSDVKERFAVLWDAEFPALNKRLFLTELPHVLKNRKIIYKALVKNLKRHPLVVAEFPRGGMRYFWARLAAVSFPFTTYHRLDMLYTSLLAMKNKAQYIEQVMKRHKDKYRKYSVGLGLIGRGEGDNITPLISPKDLERDLQIAKNLGIKNVVLYRLGGLNDKYLTLLKKYSN